MKSVEQDFAYELKHMLSKKQMLQCATREYARLTKKFPLPSNTEIVLSGNMHFVGMFIPARRGRAPIIEISFIKNVTKAHVIATLIHECAHAIVWYEYGVLGHKNRFVSALRHIADVGYKITLPKRKGVSTLDNMLEEKLER